MISRLLMVLFIFSGTAALIYEIVWVRWLTLLTGTTQHAVSVVLAIFFTGLALGAFLAGRLSDKVKRPVFLYGLIELLVGIWALISPLLIEHVKNTSIYGGVIVFLLPPTVLLGASFPILVKALGKAYVSLLYSLNTFGAVLGVLIAGFFFPPILGLTQTVRIAGILSFGIGVVAIFLGLFLNTVAHSTGVPQDADSRSSSGRLKLIFLILFLGGFAAIALEVLWTKLLVLVMGGSIYTFSTVLVVYLLGIAGGSILAGRINIKNPSFIFFLTQMGIGVGVIAVLFFFDRLPVFFLDILNKVGNKFWLLTLAEAGLSGIVILVPTLLMGIAFPLAVRLLGGEAGKSSGYAYGINTIGGVLGSLVAGFLLIPILGLQRSLLGLSFIYLGSSLLVLTLFFGRRRLVILPILAAAVLGIFLPSWNKEILTSGVYLNAKSWIENKENARLIFYKEGLYGTVTVRKFPEGVQILQINGKNEASSDFDADAAVLLGHLPMVIHPDPQQVLLMGLGGGFTLDSLNDYKVKNIDVIEIEPVVVEAARVMKEVNGNVLEDPKVNIIIEDGRKFLISTAQKYDVIVSQPSNPWLTGVSNLFTKEYYEIAKAKLKDNGFMVSWLQLYGMPPEDLRIALRTFLQVFPDVQVWTNLTGRDLILIGSRTQIPAPKASLTIPKLEIDSTEELMGYFLLDRKEAKDLVGEGSFHTDDLPVLEFSGPKTLYRETTRENLELLISKADLREGKWETFRDLLLKAQVAKMKGELGKSQEAYQKALEIDPKNRQVARLLAGVMFDRATAFRNEGKIDETITIYDEIKKIYPEGFAAYRANGEFLLSRSRLGNAFHLATVNQAEKEFLEAVRLADYDSETHTNLGVIAGIYGDYPRAEREFLRALELNPRSTLALNNLAKAYWDQGKKQEARLTWRKSLSIDTNQLEINKALRQK